MHKLLDFACRELDDIENKIDKGKLTMSEIQYADLLAHLKKSLLTIEAMEDSDYSRDTRGSYRRGRDSMGRYASRDDGYSRDLEDKLRELEHDAHDEESRRMVKEWMEQLKRR